jgi:hypothetical protein
LSQNFIDFLHSYFKDKIIKDEIDLNLRFYVSILQSYIEYLRTRDKIIKKGWKEEIKPFLLKVYPFTQDGIFNINADIKYLINDIDTIIEKSEFNNINIDNILNENKNIIYKEKDEFEDDLDIIKIDIEEKLNNDNNQIKDNLKEDYKDDYEIERIKRPFEFKNHSPTLASKSTSFSLNDDLNEKMNENNVRHSYTAELKTLLPKIKEITPFFSDEFETQGITIVKKNKIITQMTLNLFLKKIVVGNFFDEYLEYTINFTEQCFYFMKREIVFKKIIDCYRYYTEIKVPFDQRKKLINFMSLLVIKLYYCFTRIDQKEEILSIIKKFYNDRIKEIKPMIIGDQKSGNTIQGIFLEGINYIKNSMNKLMNSDNNENKHKEKEIENNEIKKGNIDIKENLNIILAKRIKLNKEPKQKNIIFKEEKINKEKEKEKEQKKEKGTIEEQTLEECEEIINIIKNTIPKAEILSQAEKNLYISKLKKILTMKKENSNSKNTEKKLNKSRTERTLKVLNLEDEKSKTKSSHDKNSKKFYFSCLNYEIKEIGEQLINISTKSIKKIKRKELYNGAYLKKSKLITSPNVIDSINKFNRLISFIIEDILSYDFPQDRAHVLERWVNIADYLKKRKDYNDLLAINSALKNYVITGLNLTWKELSSKTKKMISELDLFCSFNKNYKHFREDMNSLNKNDFYVPYLGMLLKDLNFYEENYKYIVDGNMINFEKINGVQKTIDEFFRFKNIKDKKTTNLNEELNFFENLDDKKETYLEDLASKLEPKFTLYNNPRKIKRLTYVDKHFFRGNLKRGSLTESIRLNIQ